MGLGRLGEGEGLFDVDPHRSRPNHADQLVRCVLKEFPCSTVSGEGLSGEEERSLVAEHQRVEGFHRSGGIAVANQCAERRQAVDGTVKGVPAHGIVDYRNSLPIGDLANFLNDIFLTIEDRMRASMSPCEFCLGFRTHAANDRGS